MPCLLRRRSLFLLCISSFFASPAVAETVVPLPETFIPLHAPAGGAKALPWRLHFIPLQKGIHPLPLSRHASAYTPPVIPSVRPSPALPPQQANQMLSLFPATD